MTMPASPHRPPAAVLPVTVPGDLILLRQPGIAIWAGAVSAWPEEFEFTLLMLFHGHQTAETLALHPRERGARAWLSLRYADGRHRAADLNANMPSDQPEGPALTPGLCESSTSEGWDRSRWRVTPIPPPGPVELTIHLSGQGRQTCSGYLDGQAITTAAARAATQQPERTTE
jgi:hypothetical protein